MQFHFLFILNYIEPLLAGLRMTVALTVSASLAGIMLGFAASLARTSMARPLRALATGYVEFFRGTPLLVQLFWIFFCVPLLLHVDVSVGVASFVTLTLYMGAVTCETFRGSFASIRKEDLDACVALGLSRTTRILYVVAPIALIRSTPPLLSNVVSLFKESALVSALGMADLMFVGQNIANASARPVEVLTSTALIYFVVAFPVTQYVARLERGLLRRF
jgi:polar amino acid transport system permease protein